MRSKLALLALVSCAALFAACSRPSSLHVYSSTMFSATKVSRLVTKEQAMSVPLLILFDEQGRLVRHESGWDGASTIATLEQDFQKNGEVELLPEVRQLLGHADEGDNARTIIALSIGKACAPCIRMESDIEDIARRNPRIRFELYSVTVPGKSS